MQLHKDFSLAPHLWYKIGGTAQYFLDCSSKEDIYQALDFIHKNTINKIFVIGLGSNLLFTDKYFDGAVIRIVRERDHLITLTKDEYIEAFAGETLENLIQFSFTNNFIGLEWAGGLPGTVGAAVRGNVGAFGGEIKDTIYQAEVITIENSNVSLMNLGHNELEFSYRNSAIKREKHKLVISALFILSKTDLAQIEKAKETYILRKEYRKSHHPLEYSNCGSVFKNIVEKENIEKIISVWPDIAKKVQNDWYGKVSMGYVINRLGFSGYQIGGAQVSLKHANFIVNLGSAKFTDVIEIINVVTQKCADMFHFVPETEVEIVQ